MVRRAPSAAGCGVRARLLRFAPPRRTAYHHRPTTYPDGYTLADIGPLSMLDDLGRPATAERLTPDTVAP